ncbi:MAG TPA: Fur family transcriptional regulator [Methylomusa anaerophila]|uniref:Zinc-specific metallo-regulatory protein n=1 Tax=Methylomusa anaerophila TaxID=1930071 RepID=A0A348AGT6_9FIRM|nr:Fur family transcriptional regulator [Methylomusa anaerophila]BBB90284.1 zinc-specific metallo-regulatory protein [Methylomusa anaerophila]HML89371.1 Fur family transcriptional regulator [Methylomusa anaerophila]
MKDTIHLLREKGFKVTPQRRAVIEALLECGKFPTAQQILEYVRKIHPEIGVDTVYRNLNLLADIGAIQQINVRGRDGNVFELTQGHHHHFICLGCGHTQCLDYCPVREKDLEQTATAYEFDIVSHSLEFYGFCQNCRVNRV